MSVTRISGVAITGIIINGLARGFNDSNRDLALLYQIIAVALLLCAWSLLMVKLKREG